MNHPPDSSHARDSAEPDFTIITPSYNYALYIEDCLKSVAQQSGISFEHLVMDAGSTDKTAEVVANYTHAQFFQEPDKGMSDAINKGFRMAKGKWVMWLNADDFLAPGALARVRDFANSKPSSDVVFGTYRFVDREGTTIRAMRLLPYSRFISLHYGCYVPSTATFLRRETTIAQGHLLDERMRTVMDNEYYARLNRAGKKFTYFPCILAGFRIHEANLSQVGGVEHGTLDHELVNAKMAAEPEAVRRAYGITLSRNMFLTHGIDFVLYLIAWVMKGVMKLPFWFITKH